MANRPSEIPARRARLQAALQAAAPGEVIALDDLLQVYGVSKARMSNKIGELRERFPEPTRRGKQHVYPAQEALRALLDDIELTERHRNENKTGWTERLILADAAGQEASKEQREAQAGPTIKELREATRTAREQLELAAEMKKLVPADRMQEVIAALFTATARGVLSFRARLDPQGALPPDMVSRIDRIQRELLVEIREAVADIIDDDSDDRPDADSRAGRGSAAAPARRVSSKTSRPSEVAA